MKIDSLTKKQKEALPAYAKKWIEIGLQTGETDWKTFDRWMPVCYSKAGIPYPKNIVRVSSPLAGALAASIAESILVRNSQVSPVAGAVYGAVHGAVGNEVHGAVHEAVRGAVHDAVHTAVHAAVRNEVHGAVGAEVHAAVRGAVDAEVEGAVGAEVYAAVRDEVHGAVESAVGNEVRGAVREAVGAAVGAEVYAAVREEVDGEVGAEVEGAVDTAVRATVRDEVHGAVRNQVESAVGNEVHGAVVEAVEGAVGNEVHGAVRNAVDAAMESAVYGAVHGAVGAEVHAAVREAVGAEVEGAVRRKQLKWHYWLGGQFWVGSYFWGGVAFVNFFFDVCGLKLSTDMMERAKAYRKISESVNYIWPNRKFVMVCARPSALHRNARGRLHNEHGMSIRYPDGWGLYHLNGVRFGEALYKRVISREMSAGEILKIRDIDQRTQALKFAQKGIRDFYLSEGGKRIDRYVKIYIHEGKSCQLPYELWKVPGGKTFNKTVHFMVYQCPSALKHNQVKEYTKGVPPFKKVREAMSWGMSSEINKISPEEWEALVPLSDES